jgi:hypothetical protein
VIHFTGFFSKTISPEIFSGTLTKNLSGTRDERTVRHFPKMPHRTFREDSCIQSQPHAADPESNLVSASPLFISATQSAPSPVSEPRKSIS